MKRWWSARWTACRSRRAGGSSGSPSSTFGAAPPASSGASVSRRWSMHAAATSARSSVGPPSQSTDRTPRAVARCSSAATGVRVARPEAVDVDLGAARRDLRVARLGVDLDPRPRLREQRDLVRHAAAARDRRDDRLRGQPPRHPPLALVVVEEVRVALGAQRPGADEDRVDRRAQLAQQRAVGRMAEADRASLHRRAAVGRGDHRRRDPRAGAARPGLPQAERGHDLRGGPRGPDRTEGQQARGHPRQYAAAVSGS